MCSFRARESEKKMVNLMVQHRQIVRKKVVMALYSLYSRSSVSLDRIEGSLGQALNDKDSSVVFSALSVWKLIVAVRSNGWHRDALVSKIDVFLF